jgi:apolipoprotein N-acyltransferase
LSALLMVPPFALMTALVAALSPRSILSILLVWPAVWIAQEGFRTFIWVFGGFPWALVAYPLADRPEWIQTASLGGVWLTSGLVVLLNALVFSALRARVFRTRVALGSAAVLLMGSVLVYGVARMRGLKKVAAARSWISVGVLQPNVSQDERWTAEARRAIYEDLVARTRAVARELKGTNRLILWPESASPYQWSWSQVYRTGVVDLCRELDVAILLSTAWSDVPESDEAPIYNAAVLVTPSGPVLPPYFKIRLVPFGEYVPLETILRKIKPISRAVPGGFTAGTSSNPIPFATHRLWGAICYEVVYPWIVREEVRKGADLLFTLTNDSWYGTAGARRQHWQAAVFRAVETGTPLVRAAITGISGVVSPIGESSRTIGPDKEGSFVAEFAVLAGRAPAVVVGDTLLYVCVLGLLAAILRVRVLQPREPAADGNPSVAERKLS